jgi:hypothetical protein
MYIATITAVSMAVGYGLDGRGLISGRDMIFLFSRASGLAQGPTDPPI